MTKDLRPVRMLQVGSTTDERTLRGLEPGSPMVDHGAARRATGCQGQVRSTPRRSRSRAIMTLAARASQMSTTAPLVATNWPVSGPGSLASRC